MVAASEAGNAGIARLFLDSGADVNAVRLSDGYAALRDAARGGFVDLARLLLDAGADVNAAYTALGSALNYVVRTNFAAVARA
mmetsp:Transcript_19984/g.32959  ORF Transcript_19984/g.32959 Transcript_19984/m.32959 type:complete len:83 (+) Transcript_19984:309-557(+)